MAILGAYNTFSSHKVRKNRMDQKQGVIIREAYFREEALFIRSGEGSVIFSS
jgi:hypothetical protein